MQIRGTINKSRCEPDADLVCYSGFSDSNFLHQPYLDAFDVGTGDFSVYGWFRLDRGTSGAKALFSHGTEGQNNGFLIALDLNAGCYDCGYLSGTFIASSGTTAIGTPYPRDWAFVAATRNAGTLRLYVNGREVARGVDSVNWTTLWTQPGTRLGARVNGSSGASDISMALWRASPIGMGAKHVERIYNDERKLFAPGAKCTLYGTSATITTTVNATPAALAYDPDTNLLHAGTSSGRTAFNGLVRAEFSTTPIGGALSASNGLVVEE
jgi:hypothetical protein